MTADPDDTLLVLRAQAGDIEAFDGLFRRYGPLLLKHLQYVLRDDSLAEDVLQDTLILMYRKLKWVRDPASVRPWLYRVATREALRALDRRRRRAESPLDESPQLTSASLEHLLDRSLLGRAGREEVARLPPASRAVLSLHYLEAMPLADVAGVLGIPIGTVKSRLAAGLDRLRQTIGARLGPARPRRRSE